MWFIPWFKFFRRLPQRWDAHVEVSGDVGAQRALPRLGKHHGHAAGAACRRRARGSEAGLGRGPEQRQLAARHEAVEEGRAVLVEHTGVVQHVSGGFRLVAVARNS